MNTQAERILLVENDPENGDLIARQTLQPLGYRVQVVGAASQAIQEAARFAPDVIIVNLKLPGLSGKDLLVALSSQGLDVPVIVLADKGMESDVIQTFRLGASDFLNLPVREAEVVSAVERALKQVRARRERENLARQVKQTNLELQRRVRELTTIFAIGKAVTSVTDQRVLFDKIVEGAVFVTEADFGWFLVRDERGKNFILSAHRNLPESIVSKVGQPWDDGVSSLVGLSGESLSIHGDPLKRFKVSRIGQSALVVPVKVKNEVVGLLVVVRKAAQPFGSSNQALLEAVADYASISLVNARLFKALEERASTLQQAAESAEVSERIKDETLQSVGQKMRNLLSVATAQVDLLMGEEKRSLNAEQVRALRIAQDNLRMLKEVLETALAAPPVEAPKQTTVTDLADLVRQAYGRFQRMAQQGGVNLMAELPSNPLLVKVNPAQITKVFESLLSNAINASPQGKQVIVRVERTSDNQTHIAIQDFGPAIDSRHLPHLFDRNHKLDEATARRFEGLGIGLPLINEIVSAHGGRTWVESKAKEGSTFHVTLPAANL